MFLSMLGDGFEQVKNLVGKDSEKSTGTLDLWKLLSKEGADFYEHEELTAMKRDYPSIIVCV